MAKGSGINKKYKPTGALADIIGKSPVSYSQVSKKLWKYIDKHDLQGETGDGYTVKFGKKTYKGGQVIHSGEDPKFKKFAGGKGKISMVQLGKLSKKHMKEL